MLMLTRYYKDYSIVVTKVETNLGTGFRAMFSIPKTNGMRERIQCYETYCRKRPSEVLGDVQRIIDAL